MTFIAGLLDFAVDYKKYIAIAGVVLAVVGYHKYATNAAFNAGQEAERQAAIIAAGKRIKTMEQSNETFRNSSAVDRCRIFMRDSGLPESHCK